MRRQLLLLAPWLAGAAAAQAPATPSTRLPTVELVVTSPLGAGARDRQPANVQQIGRERLDDLGPLNLPELLGRHLGSVNVNETQGNPYQVEVNFRGFTASPLLGAPQGLSVYVDGVRVNEPFGDVVNWDLIPRRAIAGITLVPGSNPLFGLNTLGGALAVRMKRGDRDAGSEAELGLGSSGRRNVEVAHGRELGETGHLYLAAAGFEEDGWRDFSASRLGQFFLRGGAAAGATDWDVALTHAHTDLVGNGLAPDGLLATRRTAIYTRPDRTRHRLTMLTLQAERDLSGGRTLAATAYLRHLATRTLNGDLNDDYDPPAVTETGVENRTAASQRGAGLALQWTQRDAAGQWLAGATHDRARTRFRQTEAEGMLDATRGVVPTDDPETDALIHGRTRTTSLFASRQWSAAAGVDMTLAARFNRTRVTTVDVGRRTLGLPTTLDGDATYTRLNPSLGATWALAPALTAYASVGQGNRAPSPIELGCSDPANPCVLPNALQSDPPLKQVVARTVEAGLRGRLAQAWDWNVSAFATRNRDDILFVSNRFAAGYFQNFGRTLRRGLEAGVAGRRGAFDAAAQLGLLEATYESPACIVAEANSSAETSAACPGEGEIAIRPGDRIPNLPRATLKLDLGWRVLPALRLGANLAAQSSQFVRGNENNAHRADGSAFFGSGRVGGFALLNVDARWKSAGGWTLGARLSNVFDRRAASGGALGENAFGADGALLAPDGWRNERFVAPAAPRALWFTASWTLGAEAR
jgi:iron complex outermembrane receptor protein